MILVLQVAFEIGRAQLLSRLDLGLLARSFRSARCRSKQASKSRHRYIDTYSHLDLTQRIERSHRLLDVVATSCQQGIAAPSREVALVRRGESEASPARCRARRTLEQSPWE